MRAVGLLMRWELLRLRPIIAMLLAIQVALGVGIVYGFSFLIPHITPVAATYLATGAPALALVLLGLNVLPQEVAQARINGRHQYVSALPVPRLAPMLAQVGFWVVIQLPGSAATFLFAMLKFHIHVSVSPLLAPAVLLVSLTTAAVGYGIAVSMPPTATQQLTQFVSIGLILFSPIDYPLSRLPVVLQDIHRVLPVTYMADIVRGSLTGSYGTSPALAFAVVGAWCSVGLVLATRAAQAQG
jgi:ABC-2 type transport system permease protein